MPKNATRNTGNGPVDLGLVARLGQEPLERAARLQARMIRDSMRFQSELFDFARRRLGAEFDTQKRLAKCRNVNEAAEVVNDFCQTAIRDYSDEATGLMKLCAEMAAEEAEEAVRETKASPPPSA